MPPARRPARRGAAGADGGDGGNGRRRPLDPLDILRDARNARREAVLTRPVIDRLRELQEGVRRRASLRRVLAAMAESGALREPPIMTRGETRRRAELFRFAEQEVERRDEQADRVDYAVGVLLDAALLPGLEPIAQPPPFVQQQMEASGSSDFTTDTDSDEETDTASEGEEDTDTDINSDLDDDDDFPPPPPPAPAAEPPARLYSEFVENFLMHANNGEEDDETFRRHTMTTVRVLAITGSMLMSNQMMSVREDFDENGGLGENREDEWALVRASVLNAALPDIVRMRLVPLIREHVTHGNNHVDDIVRLAIDFIAWFGVMIRGEPAIMPAGSPIPLPTDMDVVRAREAAVLVNVIMPEMYSNHPLDEVNDILTQMLGAFITLTINVVPAPEQTLVAMRIASVVLLTEPTDQVSLTPAFHTFCIALIRYCIAAGYHAYIPQPWLTHIDWYPAMEEGGDE